MNCSSISSRLLVAVPTMSGLSDRITGVASAFLVSLVTKRVFQIGRHDGLLPLETAFVSPSINWSRSQDAQWLMQPLSPDASIRGGRDYSMTVMMSREYLAFNTIEDHRMQYKLTNRNILYAIPSYYKTVMMSMNRGKTIAIMDNPNHKKDLESLGLSKQNVFGCIVNFLLQPLPQIFLPLKDEIFHMSDRSDSGRKVLKIGIQIRIGDDSWGDHHRDGVEDLAHYMPYFKCARQIEKFALHGRDSNWTSSLWYILTESVSLRRAIKRSFQRPQRRIVAATEEGLVVEHSSKEIGVCRPTCAHSSTVSERGFQTAAAEWWLMGLADYHVITEASGYGRTASMRAMKPKSIYTVPPYDPQQAKRMRVNCWRNDFTPLWKLSSDWSGI
eukprot:gene32402-41978_t